MCVLLGLTVNIPVAQDESAVVYNNYTKQFGQTLEQGAYTLVVGDTLYKFKRTLQDVGVHAVDCVTADRLQVSLTVSAQFQYKPEALVPIVLMQFKSDALYQQFVDNFFRNVILGACGTFTTIQYYEERGTVFQAMYDALTRATNADPDYAVTFVFFQLIDIDFPTNYTTVIQHKQQLIQQETTSLNSRLSQLIVANTSLFQNEYEARITLVNASERVSVIENQAAASYAVVLNQWQRRALTLLSVVNSLGLNATQALDFLTSEVIRQSNTAVLAV